MIEDKTDVTPENNRILVVVPSSLLVIIQGIIFSRITSIDTGDLLPVLQSFIHLTNVALAQIIITAIRNKKKKKTRIFYLDLKTFLYVYFWSMVLVIILSGTFDYDFVVNGVFIIGLLMIYSHIKSFNT